MEMDYENIIKEFNTCADFTEMDEDMWVCLGANGDDYLEDEFSTWERKNNYEN